MSAFGGRCPSGGDIKPSAFDNVSDNDETTSSSASSSSSSDAQEPAAPTGIIHAKSTLRYAGGTDFAHHAAMGRDMWFSDTIDINSAKRLARYLRRMYIDRRGRGTPSEESYTNSPLTGTSNNNSGSQTTGGYSPLSPHGGPSFESRVAGGRGKSGGGGSPKFRPPGAGFDASPADPWATSEAISNPFMTDDGEDLTEDDDGNASADEWSMPKMSPASQQPSPPRAVESRPGAGTATDLGTRTGSFQSGSDLASPTSSIATANSGNSNLTGHASGRRREQQRQQFQVKSLATGGNGTILLATCGNVRVVVKLTDYENAMRESSILRRLSKVPNVIHLLGFVCKPHQQSFVFLEHAAGGSLRAKAADFRYSVEDDALWVQRRETMLRPYVRQMVAAVGALHHRGIVHLDVKCDNFVLAEDGETVKLIDFGTSRFCDTSPMRQYAAFDTRRKRKAGGVGAGGGGERRTSDSREESEVGGTWSSPSSPITPGRGAITFEQPGWEQHEEDEHPPNGDGSDSDDSFFGGGVGGAGGLARGRGGAGRGATAATSSSGSGRGSPQGKISVTSFDDYNRREELRSRRNSSEDDDVEEEDGPLEQTLGSVLWMAPEILRGQVTAYQPSADIWSLACAIVEVVQGGEPPWCEGFATPHSAVWAIGISKSAPSNAPRDCSPALVDFFDQCFQQDAALRATARQLMDHPWILGKEPQVSGVSSGGDSDSSMPVSPASTLAKSPSSVVSSGGGHHHHHLHDPHYLSPAKPTPVPVLRDPPLPRAHPHTPDTPEIKRAISATASNAGTEGSSVSAGTEEGND